MKRVFLIVLDSVGAGAAPDAHLFGDANAHTLKSVSKSEQLHIPNLLSMGLGNVDGLDFLGQVVSATAIHGKLAEKSMGKDTTIGHWELAGLVSPRPLPTYPNGFPAEILTPFAEKTGRKILCNLPYSGTDVIRDYGREHAQTGALIVYTSADSVFQIAAHEDVVPVDTLYEYCRIARELLQGEHGVGRVIARPFTGQWPYTRTSNRRDFSLVPSQETLLDAISQQGMDVIAVGKIEDIFAARGMTRAIHTHGNTHGLEVTLSLAKEDFHGLCFVNLVDFDMLYGHRQNVDGYAAALSEFDAWLPSFLQELGEDDLLIITADHGCDPADESTDHTREYVPALIYGKSIAPANFGTEQGFDCIAATVADFLGADFACQGKNLRKREV